MRKSLWTLPALLAVGWMGAQEPADTEVSRLTEDDTHRMVFYAVLEGLYEDGVSSAEVDVILLEDPRTGNRLHFVYGCPLCTPALEAFRAYRARPTFLGKKGGETDTFGPGLAPELRTKLLEGDLKARLDVVNVLVERWIRARLELMRLRPDERAAWEKALAERRKSGMELLESLRSGGQILGMERCAICDGAAAGSERR